jgi:hypothetical protein
MAPLLLERCPEQPQIFTILLRNEYRSIATETPELGVGLPTVKPVF